MFKLIYNFLKSLQKPAILELRHCIHLSSAEGAPKSEEDMSSAEGTPKSKEDLYDTEKESTPAIAAGVSVGGVVLLLFFTVLVVLLVFLAIKRRQKQNINFRGT